MADNHIDFSEVSEYGRYFLDAVATLESSTDGDDLAHLASGPALSPASSPATSTATSTDGHLVDIKMIRDLVEEAMLAVEVNLPNATDSAPPAGRQISVQTGVQANVQAAVRDCRERVQGFYYYLRSLPPEAAGDLLAFFPAGRLGALTKLGPAELAGKMAAIDRAFSAPGNLGLANALAWREELAIGRDALTYALAERARQQREANHSGALAHARAYFLRVYHGLAKPAVRALLTYLGRDHEYRRFFLDLQRSERRLAMAA